MDVVEKKEPLLSPIMRWFMFAMVLANIGAGMYPMFIPIYMRETLGAEIIELGYVFTIASVGMMVLQLFGGWVSDAIGRLKAIAIGSVLGVFGFIAMLLAPTWQWMTVAMIVMMSPGSLVGPSFGSFIAENSTEENRGKVYGVTDTLYQVVGVIGPPLGGVLMFRFGFKSVVLAGGILYVIAAGIRIWMATTMNPDSEKQERQEFSFASLKQSMRTMVAMLVGGGVITWIFITDGVRDIAFGMSNQLQPLYFKEIIHLGEDQIGYLGAIFAMGMMTTPMLSGRMSDKRGERVPLMLGFGLLFVGFMIFLNVTNFLGFVVAWIIAGMGVGLLSPAYQSFISKVIPQKMLGTFTGLFRSSIGLISLPAPLIGTLLWENVGPKFPFYVTAVMLLLSIPPIWFVFVVPDKKEGTEVIGAVED